jgi:hypothetical protein
MDGVSEGVTEGTSTRTGISLATACIAPIASDGRKFPSPRSNQGPTVNTRTTATIKAAATSSGRSQSC